MTLPEVLKALSEGMPNRADWIVAIMSRRQSDGSLSDEIVQYPVVDVSVDHEDAEINLLTDGDSPSPRPASGALTLGALLGRLQRLKERCRDYTVFSGSARVPVGDGFWVRIDVPLVGVVCDREARVYGFLQAPREQWETMI